MHETLHNSTSDNHAWTRASGYKRLLLQDICKMNVVYRDDPVFLSRTYASSLVVGSVSASGGRISPCSSINTASSSEEVAKVQSLISVLAHSCGVSVMFRSNRADRNVPKTKVVRRCGC